MHTEGLQTHQAAPVRLPARGWSRGVRASIAAVVTVTLATLGHTFGHGEGLPISVLIVVAVAAAVVAYLLTARRVRSKQLIGLLGAAQLAVHYLSEYVSAGVHHSGEFDPLLMVAGHVGATLITALLLAHGERAWWWWLQWLHRPRILLKHLPVIAAAPTLALPQQLTPLASRIGSGTIGGRAPPAVSVSR